MTLCEVLAEPGAAFRKSSARPSAWLAALALVAMICIGGSIQAAINHRENAQDVRHALQAAEQSVDAPAARRRIEEAAHPALINDAVNVALYVVIILVGVVAETGIAICAIALSGGRPGFLATLRAMFSVAVWSIGLYYVLMSIIVRLVFADRADYTTMDAVFPSALSLFDAVSGSFARGLLAAINPFSAWALWAHAEALRAVGALSARRAYGIAGLLFVIEIGAAGLVVWAFG